MAVNTTPITEEALLGLVEAQTGVRYEATDRDAQRFLDRLKRDKGVVVLTLDCAGGGQPWEVRLLVGRKVFRAQDERQCVAVYRAGLGALGTRVIPAH